MSFDSNNRYGQASNHSAMTGRSDATGAVGKATLVQSPPAGAHGPPGAAHAGPGYGAAMGGAQQPYAQQLPPSYGHHGGAGMQAHPGGVVQGRAAAPQFGQHAAAGGGGPTQAQPQAAPSDIKTDLRKAMKGWGSDDKAIFARIHGASWGEIQAVLADAALMSQLKKEVSRSNMQQILEMLQAPIGHKLHLAMSGWGHDVGYIFRALNAASPAELAAIAADNALVGRLKDELSRANMNTLLDHLNYPLVRKIGFAMQGWGCDDQYITSSVARAPFAEVAALATNPVLMAKLGSEMSGKAFTDLKGMMARRILFEGHNPNTAWAMIDDPSRSTRATRLLSVGPVPQQRQLCDAVIAGGLSVPEVSHAFESYWNIALEAAGGQWTIPQLVQVHNECKRLPEGDVRNGAFRKLALISGTGGAWAKERGELQLGADAAGGAPAPYGVGTLVADVAKPGARRITVKDPAVFSAGATISVGHGTSTAEVQRLRAVSGNTFTFEGALGHDHGVGERITPDDQTAMTDVQWLPAVIRHEIAHSVDTALGGLVRSGFSHGLGGFDSGVNFDTWASTMPGGGWSTNDGSVITAGERKQIKAAIEAAKQTAGGLELYLTVPNSHPINKYWTKEVPVIEAAKPCVASGKDYWHNPEMVRSYNGRRFAINLYYHEYQYYNEQVHASRVRDYSIFAPAEFFAEVYTVFYEQVGMVPDAQLGARVPVASWRDWIRNNVHNRGFTPAVPRPAGAHPTAPGASPAPTAALPSPGVGKGAGNSGHV